MKTLCSSVIAFFLASSVFLFGSNGTGYAAWVHEKVTSAGFHSCIALDSNGNPHIAYETTGHDSDSKIMYASHDGSSWQTEIVAHVGDFNSRPSLALDSNGTPMISYTPANDGGLEYAARGDSSWTTQTVDSSWGVGRSSSITMDTSGNPQISHYKTGQYTSDGHLKFALWNGSSWENSVVDDTDDTGYSPSLALDSAGQARISYFDYGNRQDLKYAAWSGTDWDIEIVDSDGVVGRGSSLKLDQFDRPIISYHSYNYKSGLKYAAWNGVSWDIQTVDSDCYSMDTSLALDSSGASRMFVSRRWHRAKICKLEWLFLEYRNRGA